MPTCATVRRKGTPWPTNDKESARMYEHLYQLRPLKKSRFRLFGIPHSNDHGGTDRLSPVHRVPSRLIFPKCIAQSADAVESPLSSSTICNLCRSSLKTAMCLTSKDRNRGLFYGWRQIPPLPASVQKSQNRPTISQTS